MKKQIDLELITRLNAVNGKEGLPRLAFSRKEVAQLIGCSPGHVNNEIARGHLKASHSGKLVKISLQELLRYLQPSP
jgi:excisionase family DNA binding protein